MTTIPSVVWTQTIVTLTSATSVPLVAANNRRKGLRWMNIDVNPMTVVPGTTAAVAGSGFNYNAAASTITQGGSDTFFGEMSQQAFQAISTGGGRACVWEGF